MQFDSEEERYFSWWLDDLLVANHITEYKRSPTFDLFPAIKKEWHEWRPRKPRYSFTTLTREHVYTPDFWVEWNPVSEGILYQLDDVMYEGSPKGKFIAHELAGIHYSVFEVKPNEAGRTKHGSGKLTEARLNRMILYHRHKVFTNLVKISNKKNSLFDQTFTPKEFFFTKTGKPRTIHYIVNTCHEYVTGLPTTPRYEPETSIV